MAMLAGPLLATTTARAVPKARAILPPGEPARIDFEEITRHPPVEALAGLGVGAGVAQASLCCGPACITLEEITHRPPPEASAGLADGAGITQDRLHGEVTRIAFEKITRRLTRRRAMDAFAGLAAGAGVAQDCLCGVPARIEVEESTRRSPVEVSAGLAAGAGVAQDRLCSEFHRIVVEEITRRPSVEACVALAADAGVARDRLGGVPKPMKVVPPRAMCHCTDASSDASTSLSLLAHSCSETQSEDIERDVWEGELEDKAQPVAAGPGDDWEVASAEKPWPSRPRKGKRAAAGKGKQRCVLKFLFTLSPWQASAFRLVPRLLGHSGRNMQHVWKESGCNIRVRGIGSGYREGPQRQEAQVPLQIVVTSASQEAVSVANRLVRDMLRGLGGDFGRFCASAGIAPPGKFYTVVSCQP